ncbi:MAG: hypothetical protein GY765_30005 [bacterium]|nr:hypothetical protein [bacterium]
MDTKKDKLTAVLYNPSSGRGRSLKLKNKIQKLLSQGGGEYCFMVSRSEAHLKELAVKAVGNYGRIVAVGGDTTFNIIAEEILAIHSRSDSSPPALGMIGTGSANDIVRGLGTDNIETACLAVRSGFTAPMDVGTLQISRLTKDGLHSHHRLFLGTMSLGLGTTVNRYVEAFQKRHKTVGKWNISQLLSGIYGIRYSFSQKKIPLRFQLQYEDLQKKTVEKDVRCSLAVFLNTPYYANGLKMVDDVGTPQQKDPMRGARLRDGLLDLCLIDTASFWDSLRVASGVRKQIHRDSGKVEVIASPCFKLIPQGPMDVQVDGEIIENATDLEISSIKNALLVMVPERI